MNYLIDYYYSKANSILYPLLRLKRDPFLENEILEGCYLYWNLTEENIENYNIIVYYKFGHNEEYFRKYEKELLKNPNVSNFYELKDGCVYIYNLLDYCDAVDCVLSAKYSKIPEKDKKSILYYYGILKSEGKHPKQIHRILYPKEYIKEVSKELNYFNEPNPLTEVGELGSIVYKERETLCIPKENIVEPFKFNFNDINESC